MLVAMFNVVKVESVPLKSDEFSGRGWGFDTPAAPLACINPTLVADGASNRFAPGHR